MLSRVGSMVMLVAAAPSGLTAQGYPAAPRGHWAVGLSVGTASFAGATRGIGPTGEALTFAPYRPTMWGIGVTYGGGGGRVGLSAKYGEPGLGFRGAPSATDGGPAQGLLLIAENAYRLASFTGSISTRLVSLRGGPTLRPSLGAVVERWSAPGTPARMLLGGQGGMALQFALSGAFEAAIEGELGFTAASPFRPEDLPEEFRATSTWRKSLAVGVYWRFGR
jgi:hypothetical protein